MHVSRWLSGGVDRVGGADLRPYAPVLRELGITVVATSAIAATDDLGHVTFAESPNVVRMLGLQLSGQTLGAEEGSVLEQGGLVIGSGDPVQGQTEGRTGFASVGTSRQEVVVKPGISGGALPY